MEGSKYGLLFHQNSGLETAFTFHHGTKGGWKMFTISYVVCWSILLGNHTIPFIVAFSHPELTCLLQRVYVSSDVSAMWRRSEKPEDGHPGTTELHVISEASTWETKSITKICTPREKTLPTYGLLREKAATPSSIVSVRTSKL